MDRIINYGFIRRGSNPFKQKNIKKMFNLKKLFTKVKNCADNVNGEVTHSKKNVQFLNFLKLGGFIRSFKKVGQNSISITFKLDTFGKSSLSFLRIISGNKKLRPLRGSNRNYLYGNFNVFFSNNQLNPFRSKKLLKKKDSNKVLLILK